MANFRKAIEIVLKHEGGYVNDPLDAGGETNFGISKRSYPNLNIKRLTRQEAIDIYKRDFWDKNRLEEIKSDDVATKLLDTIVNIGASPNAKIVQRVCNILTGSRLNVDGIMGTKTLTLVNTIDEQKFLEQFRELQELHYRKIVLKNPSQKKFLEGWLVRAAS